MMGEVHTSSQKTVEEISFFFLHCWLSAVSARSKWIRCGCRRAHKSYKHWGNVFQTCLPGVICQEWVTLFYTERAPFHLSGVLQPIGLNVQCGITTSGHGRDVIETKTRQSRLFFCIFSCDKSLLGFFVCLFVWGVFLYFNDSGLQIIFPWVAFCRFLYVKMWYCNTCKTVYDNFLHCCPPKDCKYQDSNKKLIICVTVCELSSIFCRMSQSGSQSGGKSSLLSSQNTNCRENIFRA